MPSLTLRPLRVILGALLLWLGGLSVAQAHLMVAQRGTLNLVNNGAYMVLSLPASAFQGVDDDQDGTLSNAELSRHATRIEQQVQQGVQLLDHGTALPLEGVMLQPSHTDAGQPDTAAQILVLGRFALGAEPSGLRLRLSLYGHGPGEQSQSITVSQGAHAERLVLTQASPEGDVLPNEWRNFTRHLEEGMTHVLSGFDHLLFLLVVLATGWGLRQIGLALTAFTVGHAITLTASVFGVVRVSPAIVEPAIAATIVGMVLFDRWSQRRVATGAAPWPQGIRLGLVFGCALIHGLGLADALGGLGLDTASRLWSLAGFNIGIELAQLTVAVAAGALLWSWQRLHGLQGLVPAQQVGATLAAVVGSVWFVDRIFAMA